MVGQADGRQAAAGETACIVPQSLQEYKAHVEMGFIQVPWDFDVVRLCDLLEEHLDDVTTHSRTPPDRAMLLNLSHQVVERRLWTRLSCLLITRICTLRVAF